MGYQEFITFLSIQGKKKKIFDKLNSNSVKPSKMKLEHAFSHSKNVTEFVMTGYILLIIGEEHMIL